MLLGRAPWAHSPFVAFYELTRACDLLCRHCRASAQVERSPCELSTADARSLLEQFASFPRKPMVVLTGGDPLMRPDLFELVAHGVRLGLEVALTPSATPLVTPEALTRLKESGLARLALSLDGVDAGTHDDFRGVRGSFERTLAIVGEARARGLPVQINTTITRRNVHQVDAIADLLDGLDIVLWSVFFLVPTGRGVVEQRIAPEEYEVVFEKLWKHAGIRSYGIKTTEAPHYRRYVLQQGGHPGARVPLGVNDGKGIVFVSHTGEISPSGFLPVVCGQFPKESVVEVYQRSPVFVDLRQPDRLRGKCGACEYRNVCGGSRARAYALTGDYLDSDSDCAYVPARARS
jgi:radical SAM protein with 4Fe4S-binding SPASM domain